MQSTDFVNLKLEKDDGCAVVYLAIRRWLPSLRLREKLTTG